METNSEMEENAHIVRNDKDQNTSVFTQWNSLPSTVKTKIVEELPFSTFRNFMFLSKDSLEVALCAKPKVYKFTFQYTEAHYVSIIADHAPNLREAEDLESGTCYNIEFTPEENGECTVHRVGRNKRVEIYYVEDMDLVALRIFMRLAKNIQAHIIAFEILSSTTAMNKFLKFADLSAYSFSCDNFNIVTDDNAVVPLLVRFAPIGTALYINYLRDPSCLLLDKPFFWLEGVRKARSLHTGYVATRIHDEQVIALRAENVQVRGPRISPKAIYGMIQMWIIGKRKITEFAIQIARPIKYTKALRLLRPGSVITKMELSNVIANSPLLQSFEETYAGVWNESRTRILVLARTHHREFIMISIESKDFQ